MVKLSVIIPAYNEQARIQDTLDRCISFLGRQLYQSELIVVENGSTDETAQLVRMKQLDCSWLRMIQLDEGDKGQAVRAGMLQAQGELRYMADADLSTDIGELRRFIGLKYQTGADLVIGVRDPIIGQTKLRELMSRGFGLATGLLLGFGYPDTQAGFKLFSASAAEQIFGRLQVMGWAFDVEVLHLAQQLDLSVAQLPIPWLAQPGSKVRPLVPLRMLLDLARIRASSYEMA